MEMKFYYDLFSQPSRALFIFLKLNKIPATFCPVALTKGEQKTEEYKAINRFQQVPCIVDKSEKSEFKLSESVAIFRYIVETRQQNVADNWYPKDLQARAQVDEYLEWHHNNTRMSMTPYLRTKFLQPLMTGKSPEASRIEKMKSQMDKTLDQFENIWLKDEGKDFLVSKEISFADILAACEMEIVPKMTGYDPFENRPKLAKWHKQVKQATSPYYEEAHEKIRKIEHWSWAISTLMCAQKIKYRLFNWKWKQINKV